MTRPDELWLTLGKAARIWAAPDLLDVQDESWTAFSGQISVSYNLACCHSSQPKVLTEQCLEPTLAQKKPAVIMLAGPALAMAQRLIEPGWVTVGALPLMTLKAEHWAPVGPTDTSTEARALSLEELPEARALLADSYSLNDSTAAIAIPDEAVAAPDMSVWGCYADGQMVSCVTTVVQDGLVVIWSMATRRGFHGLGYGRQLLDALFAHHFEAGATGSLLHSSVAGEKLYRQIGFTVVEYLQLWSRPRWVLGAA
jgi:ribosomal protein S18 acetylase RimI-like enzyme